MFITSSRQYQIKRNQTFKKRKKVINSAINTHVKFLSSRALTEEQISQLFKKLDLLANRLAKKYEHSWFKFLNKDIKKKITILIILKNNIRNQHNSTRSLTVMQADDLLKQTENGFLAKHRNRLYTLFSNKPTKTVAGIRRCRQAIYDIETKTEITRATGLTV